MPNAPRRSKRAKKARPAVDAVAWRRQCAAALARMQCTAADMPAPFGGEAAWMVPAVARCSTDADVEAIIEYNCTPPRAARLLRTLWRRELVSRVGARALAVVLGEARPDWTNEGL